MHWPSRTRSSLAIVNRLRLRGLGTRRYQLDPRLSATFHGARAAGETPAGNRTSQPCSSNKLSPPTRASRRRMRAWRVPSAHSPRPTRPRKNCHQIRACGLLPCARSLSIRFWPTPIQPWEVYARDHDWTNACASFTKAIELEPTLTTAHTDFVLTVLLPLGHAAEALHVRTTRCAPIRCRWMSGA